MADVLLYEPPASSPPADLQLAVTVFGAANKAKYFSKKIAAWDPTLHPKGYKGLFIETPDKKNAEAVHEGDVIATKGGKVFKVEKQTPKGVKVNPIDPDTGEVKDGYTVLGNEIQVAVVEGAKAPGTNHQISTLEPGTYIQHPNSKKRFLISKHGKWTTVYPVDEDGNVSGKHTVLPPETVVTVVNKAEAAELTPAAAEKVKEVAADTEAVVPTLEGLLAFQATESKLKVAMAKDLALYLHNMVNNKDDEESALTDEERLEAHDAILTAWESVFDPNAWIAQGIGPTTDFSDEDGVLDVLASSIMDQNYYAAVDPNPTGNSFQGLYHATKAILGVSLKNVKEENTSHIVTAKSPGKKPDVPQTPEDLVKATNGGEAFLLGLQEHWAKSWDAYASGGAFEPDDPALEVFNTEVQTAWLDMTSNGFTEAVFVDSLTAKSLQDGTLYHMTDGVTADEYKVLVDDFQESAKQAFQNAFTEAQQKLAGAQSPSVPEPDKPEYAGVSPVDLLADNELRALFYRRQAELVWEQWHVEIGQQQPGITESEFVDAMTEDALAKGFGPSDAFHYANDWVQFPPDIDAVEFRKQTWEVAAFELKPQVEGPTDKALTLKAMMAWYTANSDSVAAHYPGVGTSGVWSVALGAVERLQSISDTNPGVWLDPTFMKAAMAAEIVSQHQAHSGEVVAPFNTPVYTKWDEAPLNSLIDAAKNESDAWKAQMDAWEASKKKTKVQAVAEVLPTKLPKVPPKYQPGVGEKTKIVIVKDTQPGMLPGAPDKPGYSSQVGAAAIYRVTPDGQHHYIGRGHSMTEAIKQARQASGAHEAIEIHKRQFQKPAEQILKDAKEGDLLVDRYGTIRQITAVDVIEKHAYDGTVTKHPRWVAIQVAKVKKTGGPGDADVMEWEALEQLGTTVSIEGQLSSDFAPVPASMRDEVIAAMELTDEVPKWGAKRIDAPLTWKLWNQSGDVQYEVEKTVRAERANLWVPELQHDYSLDQTIGAHWADAHKHFTALGWREIKPRQKDFVRYINAHGGRLTVYRNKQGVITEIDGNAATTGPIQTKNTGAKLHATLAEALAQGASIEDLDPRADGSELHRTSHVQQLIYDLAVGKQNGIEKHVGGKDKVKTDAQYLAEIEEEGNALLSMEAAREAVDRPDLKLKARGSVIAQFAMNDDPAWDYPNRMLTVDDAWDFSTDDERMAALAAILNHQGIADHVLGESHVTGVTPTFSPDLKSGHPLAGAEKLADAWDKWNQDQAGPLADVDEASREFILAKLTEQLPTAVAAREARQTEWDTRATNYRAQQVQAEIDKRREAEGTVKEALEEFDLPTWDRIEFKPQTLDEIEQLVADIKPEGKYGAITDVPAFYDAGVAIDGVVMYRPGQAEMGVPLGFDERVTQLLNNEGAVLGDNQHPINPGYNGSSALHDGKSLVLHVGTEQHSPLVVREAVWNAIFDAGGLGVDISEHVVPKIGQATTAEEALANYEEAMGGEQFVPEDIRDAFKTAAQTLATKQSAPKSIEYVPHSQAAGSSGGAPTSQRGRFTMYGFTPEEAQMWLRSRGLIGDLEPEVPFELVMRGQRRFGPIAPIHPDYLRGVANLPHAQSRVTHGLTGDVSVIDDILRQGGILSIQQRYRAGILHKISTTSANGDIRSGIDHAVFCTLGIGGACGGYSSVKVIMKPNALLRRDIVLAPHDYGGCATRYPKYRSYLNGLQNSVGDKRTNLYEPVSPKARQKHLNDMGVGSGSNEFNLGPHVPVEDMETLVVGDASVQSHVQAVLSSLLAEGRIASAPKVVVNGTPEASGVNKPIKGLQIDDSYW